MAGILGEGLPGIFISGTASAAALVTIADFRPDQSGGNGVTVGPDGMPCNTYAIDNTDTSSSYQLCIRVSGLNTNSTNNAMIIPPGGSRSMQLSLNGNDIKLVQGFACTTGGATFSGSLSLTGGVQIRRG